MSRPSLRARVQLVLLAFLVIGASTVIANAITQSQVRQARSSLLGRWRPAQTAANQLGIAYVDQGTAELGYVATGQPSYLRAFDNASHRATVATDRLAATVGPDRLAANLLGRVRQQANLWEQRVTLPGIRGRSAGPLPVSPGELSTAEAIFGQLRQDQSALAARVDTVVAEKVRAADDAGTLATWFAIGGGAAAVVAALVALLILRNSLSRPLERLVHRVETTAKDPVQPIELTGPAELTRIAAAGETMRLGVLRHAELEAEANQRLALAEEDERIARDLHDTVIQNLFATGLVLQSKAERVTATDAQEAVANIDAAIRTLRSVIFELGEGAPAGGPREHVLVVADEAARSLGFEPTVHFDGPVDTATAPAVVAELAPVLREALSNVARHAEASAAEISVSAHDGWLHLAVSDDGRGLGSLSRNGGRGLGNIKIRAERLGGRATVGPGSGGGTVLEWSVPVVGRGASDGDAPARDGSSGAASPRGASAEESEAPGDGAERPVGSESNSPVTATDG